MADGRPEDATEDRTDVGSEGSDRQTAGERFAAAVGAARTGAVKAASEAAGRGPWTGSGATTTAGPRTAAPRSHRRVRKARLRLTHIDPWSVLKTSLLLSIALGIVIVVAVGIVWSVLDAAGVWTSINNTVGEVVGDSGGGFNVEEYVGMSRVMGFTLIVAVVDVVLVTVIATLAAFLYNLAAALLGGLEVVLAEEDH